MNSKDRIKIIGLPYEGKENFLRGTSLGPSCIRWALESIEDYSVYQDARVPEYTDLGDHYFPGKFGAEFVLQAKLKLAELLAPGERFIALGGDHLITLPLVQLLHERDPKLSVLHLDAHLDRRDSFEGECFNHATVLKRVAELDIPVLSWGIRSRASCEEWPAGAFPRGEDPQLVLRELNTRRDGKIYLSLDLDVLDPSEFSAVGNPEPGGVRFLELLDFLKQLDWTRISGVDLVEFAPLVDPGIKNGALAAVLLRELLILLEASRR